MPRTWRVAVIGRTGKGNYGHGLDTVWSAFENHEMVAVADENPTGLAAGVKRCKAKKGYADWREMLEKEKPNIVSVCPRFLDCHAEMVIACAEAGASMYMEKPLCRTLEEADRMIAECERRHVKVAIAHQTRYSPRVKVIRELLASGKAGTLVEMRGRGKEDARGGGNDLMVLGTHILDLMRVFAGDARSCYSVIRQGDRLATKADIVEGGEMMGPIVGDNINAMYTFDKGVTATFGTKVRNGPGGRFGLTLLCSNGAIQLTSGSLPAAYFNPDPAWFFGHSKAAWQLISSAGVGEVEPLKDGGLHQGNVWAVADLLEAIEKDRQPLGSIYDGRGALEMILSVYESFRVAGPVELPLKNRKHPLA